MKFNFSKYTIKEGLFRKEADNLSCTLPGSALTVQFSGTHISVCIKDISGSGKTWMNAWVDDTPCRGFRVDPETPIYEIAENLPAGTHTLVLQKRTEAAFGTISIQNFETDGKFMPPAVKRRSRLVLFIGDSITCGFGNTSQIPSDVDASSENFALTYGYLAARNWDADLLACAASGTGIYQNYGGSQEGRMSDFFMGSFWQKLNEPGTPLFSPDAIVINLGTNDWSAPIRPEDYVQRYKELLDFIRVYCPDTPILCTIGSMCLDPAPYLLSMVEEYRQTGDMHIQFLCFPIINVPEDGFGGAGHPSERKHREMADILIEKLFSLL